jgi:hypothetical protein
VKIVNIVGYLIPARGLDHVLVGDEPECGGHADADADAVDEYHIQEKLDEVGKTESDE